MSFIPVKMPSAAETFSNYAAYRTVVDVTTTGLKTLCTTDNNMGQFVVTEIVIHCDTINGGNNSTYTSSIGWNASTYDNIAASVVKGDTHTGSSYNSLWLRPNKFEPYTLRTSGAGYYANYATPANTATDIKMNITATIMPAGCSISVFVIGFYAGMRP